MQTECEKTRTKLNKMAKEIASDATPAAADEWGGADVIIREKAISQKPGGFFPEPRAVVTPHSRHLTWLFYQLRDAFHELLDHITKTEFYGRLANAALRYQARCCGAEVKRELLLAVLHEAFAMLDEMEEGTFQYLWVAPGNAIADDFIERVEERGFIGVEETKRFFAERGVTLP